MLKCQKCRKEIKDKINTYKWKDEYGNVIIFCKDCGLEKEKKDKEYKFKQNKAKINNLNNRSGLVVLLVILGIIFLFTSGVISGLAALAFLILQLYLGVRLGCINADLFWSRLTGGFYRWKETGQNSQSQKGIAELQKLWEHMQPLFEQMHLEYYKAMGWSQKGIPKAATLMKLDISDLLPDSFVPAT